MELLLLEQVSRRVHLDLSLQLVFESNEVVRQLVNAPLVLPLVVVLAGLLDLNFKTFKLDFEAIFQVFLRS